MDAWLRLKFYFTERLQCFVTLKERSTCAVYVEFNPWPFGWILRPRFLAWCTCSNVLLSMWISWVVSCENVENFVCEPFITWPTALVSRTVRSRTRCLLVYWPRYVDQGLLAWPSGPRFPDFHKGCSIATGSLYSESECDFEIKLICIITSSVISGKRPTHSYTTISYHYNRHYWLKWCAQSVELYHNGKCSRRLTETAFQKKLNHSETNCEQLLTDDLLN